jgi:hypothetical protein
MDYDDIKNDEDHIRAIIEDFNDRVGPKYDRGIVEHGGDLRRKNTTKSMDEEIIDMNVYWFNERYHKWQVTQLLKKAMESDNLYDVKDYVRKALNTNVIGNPEGVQEMDK